MDVPTEFPVYVLAHAEAINRNDGEPEIADVGWLFYLVLEGPVISSWGLLVFTDRDLATKKANSIRGNRVSVVRVMSGSKLREIAKAWWDKDPVLNGWAVIDYDEQKDVNDLLIRIDDFCEGLAGLE